MRKYVFFYNMMSKNTRDVIAGSAYIVACFVYLFIMIPMIVSIIDIIFIDGINIPSKILLMFIEQTSAVRLLTLYGGILEIIYIKNSKKNPISKSRFILAWLVNTIVILITCNMLENPSEDIMILTSIGILGVVDLITYAITPIIIQILSHFIIKLFILPEYETDKMRFHFSIEPIKDWYYSFKRNQEIITDLMIKNNTK